MTKYAYNPFLLWLPSQLLSLPNDLSDYDVKFATHHPYQKNKLIGNLTWSFVYAANSLYFLYNLENLLMASLLACNSGTCITKPGLITKKKTAKNFLQSYFTFSSTVFSQLNILQIHNNIQMTIQLSLGQVLLIS